MKRQVKTRYVLGNILRGWFEGKFADDQTAWRMLSRRFLLSYPASTGRSVSMYKREVNKYGLEQWVVCRIGITWRGRLPRKIVLKYKRSMILTMNP